MGRTRSVGMTLERVFHGNGRPKELTEAQFEIFATQRRIRRSRLEDAEQPGASEKAAMGPLLVHRCAIEERCPLERFLTKLLSFL